MTSGASAASSAACLRISAALAVAQRVSIRTLRPMVQPKSASPIGDEAAGVDEGTLGVDRGQLVPRRQGDDQIAMKLRQPASGYDQAVISGARKSCDGTLDLGRIAQVDRDDLHPERRCRGLD